MRFIEGLRKCPCNRSHRGLPEATELSDRFVISYWDAAILAAAGVIRCEAVYSEDMNDQQDYGD